MTLIGLSGQARAGAALSVDAADDGAAMVVAARIVAASKVCRAVRRAGRARVGAGVTRMDLSPPMGSGPPPRRARNRTCRLVLFSEQRRREKYARFGSPLRWGGVFLCSITELRQQGAVMPLPAPPARLRGNGSIAACGSGPTPERSAFL